MFIIIELIEKVNFDINKILVVGCNSFCVGFMNWGGDCIYIFLVYCLFFLIEWCGLKFFWWCLFVFLSSGF